MSEFSQSTTEVPEFLPKRLAAAAEIAETEHLWRKARVQGEINIPLDGLSVQRRIARMALRNAFYELTEENGPRDTTDVQTVVEWFTEQAGEIPTATLARIEMNGEWDAADRFERNLIPIMSILYDKGYRSFNMIKRTDPTARITATIPAGFTEHDGFVALRRKRRFVLAEPTDPDPDLPSLIIDKVSMFALDIKRLAELSGTAAREVRLIVAMTMFKAVNWGAFGSVPTDTQMLSEEDAVDRLLTEGKRALAHPAAHDANRDFLTALEDARMLTSAMTRYGISTDDLRERLYGIENPARLHDAASVLFVENELRHRSDMLTPASTTYYVHY